MKLFGLDGCKHNAWVVAESDSDFSCIEFSIKNDLTSLLEDAAEARAVAVLDVPIGLDHQDRACDRAARALLGPKGSSTVFRPPCREALAGITHKDADTLNRLHCNGTGISIMSFSIGSRIKAVDELITPAHQVGIKEGHPEVAFAALNGNRPLRDSKDKPGGIAERMQLLKFAGLPAFDVEAERSRLGKKSEVAADDLVDAAVMLVTARDITLRVAGRLPEGAEPRDARNLLMEMWIPRTPATKTTTSKSGVRLHDDYRDNMIIDRYHPDLATMRGSKRDRLRSENSEDALTWNVFKSLGQIDPSLWLPLLNAKAFPNAEPSRAPQIVTLHLWKRVEPPPALQLHQKDEGASEIDIVIETEFSVWFIEAKFKSDISTGTTNNPTRDQVIRNLDVGSWYAGARDFYFALLIMGEAQSPKGVEILKALDVGIPQLAHRPDGLKNLKGTGLLRWVDVASVMRQCADSAPRQDERFYAQRAWAWMKERSLA